MQWKLEAESRNNILSAREYQEINTGGAKIKTCLTMWRKALTQVGDDVFRDDPTVLALEARIAAMAGLRKFCTARTESNDFLVWFVSLYNSLTRFASKDMVPIQGRRQHCLCLVEQWVCSHCHCHCHCHRNRHRNDGNPAPGEISSDLY